MHWKLFALGALLLPAPCRSQMGMPGGMMGMSSVRHQFVMRNGIDPRYASRANPMRGTAKNIAAGKKSYDQNCAACHGATGLGDGEAGKSLSPPPANIAAFVRMRMATDGYLYWTIAEGGTALGTAMPPFKSALTEDDIWKTIIYLRGGL